MLDKLTEWEAALAVFVAIAIGIGGYSLGRGYSKAEGDAALSKLKGEHATALAGATKDALKKYQDENERANKADSELTEAKQRHAAEKRALLRRIADVTTVYQTTPGSAPVALPNCVFTVGWMSVYNEAIGLPGISAPTAAGQPSAASDASGGAQAWLLDSKIVQADVLSHVIDYGERCRGLEKQVNGLLDVYEGKTAP